MSKTLASGVTATGAQASIDGREGIKTFQASGATTAGAGAATIVIQGSMNNTNWDTLGTISLTLSTTSASDSFTSNDGYDYLRANVTDLSGTGASVTVLIGGL